MRGKWQEGVQAKVGGGAGRTSCGPACLGFVLWRGLLPTSRRCRIFQWRLALDKVGPCSF